MIDYKCSKCGAGNCKLWRQYNTFLEHIRLLCAKCVSEAHGKDYVIDSDGYVFDEDIHQRTRVLGSLVPAIPTVENDTFWGYTSVPEERIRWWKELPL
jgi:hypothetical protein